MVKSTPWLLFLFLDSYIQHFEIKFRMLSINKNLNVFYIRIINCFLFLKVYIFVQLSC